MSDGIMQYITSVFTDKNTKSSIMDKNSEIFRTKKYKDLAFP